jgi:oxygen-dependent protoporphyrinogen oxidase
MLERAHEVGGRTLTWRGRGVSVDSGAGFFTNFYPTLEGLTHELDLRGDVVELSRSNWLTFDGRTAPFTVGSLLSVAQFPFLTVRDKLRLVWQTAGLMVRYRGLDLSDPASLAPLDDGSIRDEAVRRLGENVYQFVVRPAVEPFWYFSAEHASRALLLALQAKGATARFFTLRDGMDSVCRAVARRVPTRTGVTVESVSAEGNGLRVRWAEGEERFDGLVIATTASAARRLTQGLDADLVSPPMRRLHTQQRYVANIHADYLVPRNSCPAGVSALFPCGPHRSSVAAINFNSFKHQRWEDAPADTELVAVYLTADESAKHLNRLDDDLYRHCCEAASRLCPGLGSYRAAADAIASQHGPVVFAGDYLATATVDGALASGVRAAKVLLAQKSALQ